MVIRSPQKGFVMGHQILDVMITTHEIIHSMYKSGRLGMALKLNISKAYDRVNWSFLLMSWNKWGSVRTL